MVRRGEMVIGRTFTRINYGAGQQFVIGIVCLLVAHSLIRFVDEREACQR